MKATSSECRDLLSLDKRSMYLRITIGAYSAESESSREKFFRLLLGTNSSSPWYENTLLMSNDESVTTIHDCNFAVAAPSCPRKWWTWSCKEKFLWRRETKQRRTAAAETIPDHRRVSADAGGNFLSGTAGGAAGGAAAEGARASPRRTPAYRGSQPRRRGADGGCGDCCSGEGCGERERERGVGSGRRSAGE